MRSLILVALLASTTHAANEVVSPGPPPNPSSYIEFTFDITPAPALFLGQQVGSLEDRTTIVDSHAWLPKWYVEGGSPFFDKFNGRINFSLDSRPWWDVDFGPEIAAGLTAATLTLIPTPGGMPLDRTATITAPGYSRTFLTELAPEPSAGLLMLLALWPLRRRLCRANQQRAV